MRMFCIETTKVPFRNGKQQVSEYTIERETFKSNYTEALKKFRNIKMDKNIRSIHLMFSDFDVSNLPNPYLKVKYNNLPIND